MLKTNGSRLPITKAVSANQNDANNIQRGEYKTRCLARKKKKKKEKKRKKKKSKKKKKKKKKRSNRAKDWCNPDKTFEIIIAHVRRCGKM